VNLVLRLDSKGTGVEVAHQPLPVMPDELMTYFEETQ
jgi:succinate dehydrogenase / fumarate reductase flavoprotein subunit